MKVKSQSEVARPCLTLSDFMDCSLPGSSVHVIFQARVLEWGAIAFSVGMANYVPQALSGLPPVFVNKVLLEHNHTQSFTYILGLYGCFCTAIFELRSCNRDHLPCKTENIFCCFTEKHKADPWNRGESMSFGKLLLFSG